MIPAVLTALALTVAVETPVVAAVYRGQRLRMAVVCILTTSATNVGMNTWLRSTAASYDQYVLVGEACAVLVEAVVYALASRGRDVPKAMLASGAANALSYAAGLVLL